MILETGQVAVLLDCSEATVRRLIDTKEIESMPRLTHRSPRRVRQEKLQKFADRKGILLEWSRIQSATTVA